MNENLKTFNQLKADDCLLEAILEDSKGPLQRERNKWREEFETGKFEPFVCVIEYKQNRTNELWRHSRLMERMCEYILFLEDKLKELQK